MNLQLILSVIITLKLKNSDKQMHVTLSLAANWKWYNWLTRLGWHAYQLVLNKHNTVLARRRPLYATGVYPQYRRVTDRHTVKQTTKSNRKIYTEVKIYHKVTIIFKY